MTPSLSIATDNIYKFTCLFGLALIIVSILSFVSMYTASLDRKVKYMEVIIPLEGKVQRIKSEEDMLELNKKLLEVTQANEKTASAMVGIVISIGIILSVYGASRWYGQIQLRDDKLANLQIEKLEAEISKLRAEALKVSAASMEAHTNDG